MSDRIAAQITIGGTITKEQAQLLITEINKSGAGIEWEGGSDFKNIKNMVDAVRDDGRLTLCDAEARYGTFPELETFLAANQIPFDRHSDGKYEYDAEIVSYRPEFGLVRHLSTQEGDSRLVPYDDVRSALIELQNGKLTSAKDILKKILDPEIPDLPQLQIK